MDYTNVLSDNILQAQHNMSSFAPESYYHLRYGEIEVFICRDKVFVNTDKPRRISDYIYHIVCAGFAPRWHDNNHIKLDKLNKNKRIRYGNYDTIYDALYDFKRVCCSAFGGFYQSSTCSHFDDNKCLCDFSLFGAS